MKQVSQTTISNFLNFKQNRCFLSFGKVLQNKISQPDLSSEELHLLPISKRRSDTTTILSLHKASEEKSRQNCVINLTCLAQE